MVLLLIVGTALIFGIGSLWLTSEVIKFAAKVKQNIERSQAEVALPMVETAVQSGYIELDENKMEKEYSWIGDRTPVSQEPYFVFKIQPIVNLSGNERFLIQQHDIPTPMFKFDSRSIAEPEYMLKAYTLECPPESCFQSQNDTSGSKWKAPFDASVLGKITALMLLSQTRLELLEEGEE